MFINYVCVYYTTRKVVIDVVVKFQVLIQVRSLAVAGVRKAQQAPHHRV